MAVSLLGRAVPLTVTITPWLSVATALPATAQPQGPSTTDRGLRQAAVAWPDRNARSELARNGFVIDAVGDWTIIAVVDAGGLAQWIPTSPGSHVSRALAFDAGGNIRASEPLTFIAQASLYPPLFRNQTPVGVHNDKQAQPL